MNLELTALLLDSGNFIYMLESVDRQLLLAVNGSDSLFLDRVVKTLTNAWTWLPFYLSMLYIVMKNADNVRKVLYVLGGAAICVVMAGLLDDFIVKPSVARWRPTHDPEIGLLVDIVDGYRGGKYGFFSAHAANTFSLAVFFSWLVRSRALSVAAVVWSLTNCWTRLYLGVHFPGDILVGLSWGAIVGTAAWYFYHYMTRNMFKGRSMVSVQYTATGYRVSDCDIPVAVLVFTLVFTLIKAAIV